MTVLIIYLYYSIIAIYYSEKKNHEGFTYWQGYIRHISFTITLYIQVRVFYLLQVLLAEAQQTN